VAAAAIAFAFGEAGNRAENNQRSSENQQNPPIERRYSPRFWKQCRFQFFGDGQDYLPPMV